MGAFKGRRRKANSTGRSVAAHERFIMLPHYMLRSAAWQNLSPNAKALLIAVWQRHNGSNNGEIVYAVRDAKSIGLSKDVAARAFTELQDKGFLKLRRASSFTLKTKEARVWQVTAEPTGLSGDVSASKDFMRWQPSGFDGNKKSRTQSHRRDAQSHQRDSKSHDEIILPITVAPARPSKDPNTISRSHQRDTYNMPCGVTDAGTVTLTTQTDASVSDGQARTPQVSIENVHIGNTQKNLAFSVRKRLKVEGASQRQLAEALGVSRSQLCNRLAGRFGLNQNAESKLREYADGEWSLGDGRIAA